MTLFINKITILQYYGFRCHGDLLGNHTVLPDQNETYRRDFIGVSSFSRNYIIRKTIPYRNYAVSKIIFP